MEIRQTEVFRAWLARLRDPIARSRVAQRLDRLARGLVGDTKPVGAGVSELRIDHGPGYRIYYRQRGSVLIILLCGGDTSTQARDIAQAHRLAEELED